MKKLDATILCKNIVKAYKQANAGDLQAGNFYSLANDICNNFAEKYNVEKQQVAGIIAVLSPGTFWEQNIKDTEAFLKGKRSGFATYGQFVTKAIEILKTTSEAEIFEIIFGKMACKTANFYLNILGNLDVVTVDRHAYRIALNETGAGWVRMTINQYKKIESSYILASRKLNVKPAVVQAITWNYFKRANDRGNFVETAPF